MLAQRGGGTKDLLKISDHMPQESSQENAGYPPPCALGNKLGGEIMKQGFWNFTRRNSLAIVLCLVSLLALVGSELSVSSSSLHVKPGANAVVQGNAPAVNSVCLAGQSLSGGSPTFVRPSTTFTFSTGCLNDGTAPVSTGTSTPYQAFAFNVSGCAAPISLTAQVCTSACGAAATFDSVIFVYQKDNGAPGVAGDAVFEPTNPTDNNKVRSANNNACAPDDASTTVNICAGVFVVVVTSNGAGATGTFNLLVTASNVACNIISIPTLTRLESFEAVNYGSDVSLEWKTGSEIDNLGFNVYREDRGNRTRVNNQILAGSALLTGAGTDLKAGNSYSWTDSSPAGKNTKYWLEDVSLSGESTWHGPFDSNRDATGDRIRPPRGRAQLLSRLGSSSPGSETVPLPRETKPPELTIAQLTGESDLAASPAMKLSVKQEGWYRVSQPELAAAGFDTRTDPRMLQMFVDGKELAFSVSGEVDGRFDPSDAIEFYGLGSQSRVTDSRTYWLAAGSRPGQRIERIKGKGSRAVPASFPYTVERRDRSVYFAALKNGENENFFGEVIARDPVDQSIDVRHLDSSGSGAELEVALQGVSLISHRVKVEVNGVEVGAMGFDGQTEGTARIPLGKGVLKEGQNVARLTALGGDADVSVTNYLRITYPRTYTADGDALRFAAAPKRQVTIDGFSSPGIRVIDVTDPDSVREIASQVESRKGSYAVTVSAPKGGGERLLLAFAASRAIEPAAITSNRPSNLRGSGRRADLVIVTHRDFEDSVAPLKSARESQGLSVAVVDVEDVYDEFSFGQKSPEALRDFLAYARSNWQTRFALLVGDASLDPKDYLGFGDSDFVPTQLIDTRQMETASDDWLADFNGDGSAEIAIGRLPARTAEEATAMIAKIVEYDRSEPVDRVMLVADSNEEVDFEAISAELKRVLPQNLLVREINRGRIDASSAESEFIAGLHHGQKIVNYVGHGSIDQWRGSLLTSTSANGLTNGSHLPLFVMMTCLNGYFQDAAMESLAESLMKTARGGAVAVWASSAMTASTEQTVLNQQMLMLLLDRAASRSLTLGEAIEKAKSAVSDNDTRRTWILFGDPTMKLR